MPRRTSTLLQYGCAFASVLAAIWARLQLDSILGDTLPYPTLFLAILLTAAYGGYGPALVAVVVGGLGSTYYLVLPRESLRLDGLQQYIGVGLYLATGLGIALLGGAMRTIRLRAEAGATLVQRQAALFDQTHDAVLTWDWDGPITYWNRGAERLYGFSREAAVAKSSHDLLRTELAGGNQGLLSRLQSEGSWEGELEQTTLSGQRVIVESRMTLIRETEKAYVLEVNRDVTRRKIAEGELLDLKGQLETRVQQRTEELAQANDSLHETDQRLRLLVSGVKGYAILMLDPQGHVVTWNHGAEVIKGYHADEILGQHFSCFYPPEEIATGKPEMELKVAAADGNLNDEGWRVRKDGSLFWANVLITAMRDERGNLRGFSKVTRDMTEPRREEATLKQTQARMAGIIDSAMDAIISVDHDQNVVLFNAAAEKMFQCPASDALGRSLERFVPEKFRPQHSQHVRSFGVTGVTSRSMRSLGTLSGLRADGEEFPIEASISQLNLSGQKQYTVILRDITDRKRAEEALRKSEAELHTIVESLEEGVVVADLDGKIVHFNRAALEQLDFGDKVELFRPVSDFADTFEIRSLDGKALAVEEWPLALILRGHKVRDLELRLCHIQAGWEKIFNYGGTLVQDAGGQPLMAVLTFVDITERKRAAKEILQLNVALEKRVVERTVQLEAANKELEAFSYSVSHDLRAPLRAVDGFSQTLLEDFGPLLPEQGQHYINTIRSGAQRMGALIDDLLSFARLGRQPLKKRSVDTAQLVREVWEELVSNRLEPPELHMGELPPCQGDLALLRQVWVNLLSNALKYSSRRESPKIEVGTEAGKSPTVYFVRDNGTGFDMKYAHKLFGVFQRLHLREDYEGTGVGLAIVQRVIQRHGGRVCAQAEVDRGATFYFTVEGETLT